jgi:ribonuclease HI
MSWQKAAFKGGEVWAKVSAPGVLAVSGGRVPIRYSNKPGAKIYRGGASRIALVDGAPLEDLDAGVSADEAKKQTKKRRGSGFGKAGTRTKAQAAAAAADAKERLEALSDDTAVAFTDGGCKGNPGPAGSGVRVELPDGRVAEASRSLGRATNNIAELTAIDMALDLLDEAGVPPEAPVVVFSDSSYARGVLTQGWKAKANRELILGLRARLKERTGVQLQWVAGHAGVAGNERADDLATAGVRGTTATTWS